METNDVESFPLLASSMLLGLAVSWVNVDETCFYAMCWAMSFASASFTLLSDAGDKPILKCLSAGSVSGFLAVAVVALWVGRIDKPLDNHWYWIGLAILIGLSAKQGEAIREGAVNAVLGAFRAMFNGIGRGKNGDSDG